MDKTSSKILSKLFFTQLGEKGSVALIAKRKFVRFWVCPMGKLKILLLLSEKLQLKKADCIHHNLLQKGAC